MGLQEHFSEASWGVSTGASLGLLEGELRFYLPLDFSANFPLCRVNLEVLYPHHF